MTEKNLGLSVPISYSAFLILLCLQKPSHGYGIMQYVNDSTNGLITIGPATMYRSISDFLDQGLIVLLSNEGKKKEYVITPKGKDLLDKQKQFLSLLSKISEDRGE